MRGHRAYLFGSGCFRRAGPQQAVAGVAVRHRCDSRHFIIRDHQAEMLPMIIAERHRAKLARNNEDIC